MFSGFVYKARAQFTNLGEWGKWATTNKDLKKQIPIIKKLNRLPERKMSNKFELGASVYGPSISLGKGHRLILS
jgi:hypothetical protein